MFHNKSTTFTKKKNNPKPVGRRTATNNGTVAIAESPSAAPLATLPLVLHGEQAAGENAMGEPSLVGSDRRSPRTDGVC